MNCIQWPLSFFSAKKSFGNKSAHKQQLKQQQQQATAPCTTYQIWQA
jgi:hypothetical protein